MGNARITLDFVRKTEKSAFDEQTQHLFYLIVDFVLWLERENECVMYCDPRILRKIYFISLEV